MGAARIGQRFAQSPASTGLSSATEALLHAPVPEVLGTVSQAAVADLANQVPPPPWETDPTYDKHDSDARKFLDAPDNITLRWLSPKVVNQSGLRYWQAVPAKGDTRFRLKLKTLAAPDNTVRRGDHAGDFLAWMYTAWVESQGRLKAARVARQSRQATDQLHATNDAYAGGQFGRYVTSAGGRHPTHTIADGRTMGRE
jgi:hypothetical protein